MGLSLLDIMVGAVVDQAFGVNEDGKVYNRDTIRRGIITKVEGNGKPKNAKPKNVKPKK